MDFVIIWYPMAKLALAIVLLLVLYILWNKEYHKAFYTVAAITVIMGYLAPVKIDGTESKQAHRIEVQQRTAEYKVDPKDLVNAASPEKLTFNQRMEIERLRSLAANREVENEMLK